MKKNCIHTKNGFTLAELLVVTSIMGIIVTPLIYLEICFTKSFYSNIYRQDMVEAGNRSFEWIAKDLRSATSVLKGWQNESFSSDQLILKKTNGLVVYAFDEKQGVLTRAEHSETNSPLIVQLANNIDNFKIAPVDPSANLFHITLELSRELLDTREIVTMNSTVARRIQ